MKPTYPPALTTDVWVDFMEGQSREQRIATLATFHRRVEHYGRLAALSALIDPNPDDRDLVSDAAQAALDKLAAPQDYE